MTVPSMQMPGLANGAEQAPNLDHVAGYSVNEDFIRKAVAQSDASALRLALYQITRDDKLKNMKVTRAEIRGGALFDYVLDPEDQDYVRDAAVRFLMQGPQDVPPPPSKQEAFDMMDMYSDVPMRDHPEDPDYDYEEGYEELAFEPFPREVNWSREPPPAAKLQQWHVVVVGAGISGIAAGVFLKRLGIPFTIVERQGGLGGTWLLNTYPEARVDTLSYLFQYKFEKNYKWTEYFASAGETRKYLEYVAHKHGIEQHCQFHREVVKAVWDESGKKWHLTVKHKDGTTEELISNAIISASGLFSTPNLPDFPGIEDYTGAIFHTAQWQHDFDYHNKRIALIGTGSTGCQTCPELARSGKTLDIYQRTPQWINNIEGYRNAVSEYMHWMCDHMPYYWHWYCYAAFHRSLHIAAMQYRDKEWEASGGHVNKRNDKLRENLLQYIERKLEGRPDLLAKVMPQMAPLVRRLVVDNGFYDTIKRDNVELVRDKIDRLTEKGIRTTDGKEREYDLIVLGAGFKTSQYLYPVDYVGTGGMTLQKAWEKDGARSYLGMTMKNYPNLFTLYGPNHQPRGGSLYSYGEMWARYAVACIVGMIERGAVAMEVKHDVFDSYQEKLDAANKRIIWESEGSSYYVNEHGRQAVNMPWTTAQYHPMIRKPNFDDFDLEYSGARVDTPVQGHEARL